MTLSLAVLVVQEALEHGAVTGLQAELGPSRWLLLVLLASAVSAVVVVIERSCGALIQNVLWPDSIAVAREGPVGITSRPALPRPRRRNALADRRGLRAPPLPVC